MTVPALDSPDSPEEAPAVGAPSASDPPSASDQQSASDPQPVGAQRRIALFLASGWLLHLITLNISGLPINLFLKNTLEVGPGTIATFGLITGFAWSLKAVFGWFCDNIRLGVQRRRPYLFWGTLLSAGCWLAVLVLPKDYLNLLWWLTVINIMLMVVSTTLGGLMVETGRRNQMLGRLTAQRFGIVNVVGLIGGPIGGFLAARPLGLTAGICAACLTLFLLLILFFYREETETEARPLSANEIRGQLGALLRSKPLWWGLAMVSLLNIAPGFGGTPLLFYQQDTLKLSGQFIGNLGLISGGMGLLGAAIYFRICSHFPLRRLLFLGIIFSIVSALLYLAYRSPLAAILIEGANGIIGTLAFLPLMELAGRATPKGQDALGYALIMSANNLTAALSNVSGSWLYEHLHWNLTNLVWLNAGTTFLILFIVPLLPSDLVDHADGAS